MKMRMQVKTLSPGVQNRQKADVGAEAPGICGDGEQRFRRRTEEDSINFFRVLQCQPADLVRQRKHDVEIRNRQDPADMREPQKIERLWLPFSSFVPVDLGKP